MENILYGTFLVVLPAHLLLLLNIHVHFARCTAPLSPHFPGPLQSLTFAVMPADGGAAAGESEAFLAYVNATFPATADHWVGYGSESELLDVVGDPDYNKDTSDTLPAFAAGVVFTSGSPDWEYTVGARTECGFRGWGKGRESVHSFVAVCAPFVLSPQRNPTLPPPRFSFAFTFPW